MIELRSKKERQYIEHMDMRARNVLDGSKHRGLFEKNVYTDGWGWNMETDEQSALFYFEEGGNIDAMIVGLQIFLGKFRPKEEISFSWANVCSKMRPGEFSGGGVVMNATQAKWIDVQSILSLGVGSPWGSVV